MIPETPATAAVSPPPTDQRTANLADQANLATAAAAADQAAAIDGAARRRRWLVVGGGLMGLKVAQELTARGQDVTVCEAAPQWGGLASGWRLGEVSWDRFYHATLLSDDRLRSLLADLDLEKELRWVETKTGFYAQGKLISMSNTIEFLRFPLLGLVDKLRLGGTIFLASKLRDWRRLERIPVAQWLRRWSGPRVMEKIWLPLLQAKLGDAYRDTSAAFIWAHTARLYKARRSGMKRELFGYVPGGYSRILRRLVDALTQAGVTMLPGHPLARLQTTAAGQFEATWDGADPQRFDRVIYTTPAAAIADSCQSLLSEDELRRLRGVRYLGVICTSLLMRRPLSEYYVTNIVDGWVPLTGIIEMSTIVDSQRELAGHHLVYLPKYMAEGDAGWAESDAAFEEKCLATLEKMYPDFSRDDVVAMRTARAARVAALPTLRYSERLPPVVTTVPGLYVVHSAQIVKGSLNVNETLALAEEKLAAEVWPDHLASGG